MKYLIDNQLPVALARALAESGRDAVRVLDWNLAQTSDPMIWKRALDEGMIVITKDEDFFHLANREGDRGRVLWIRMGNTRKAALLSRILPQMAEIEGWFNEGQRVVEVRG
ncbi:DUF5615 family PIN-like protein [Haloferula sp. A504]|uniref:DUF5615 family PIN-like protein n=1 Tax=Haloferula sp. A504 TaxID=3373601 RepID=UPI0031BE0060|nr:DUF5615 family PIN-like protein [Verrucomicrobiaceae bacterium E54]